MIRSTGCQTKGTVFYRNSCQKIKCNFKNLFFVLWGTALFKPALRIFGVDVFPQRPFGAETYSCRRRRNCLFCTRLGLFFQTIFSVEICSVREWPVHKIQHSLNLSLNVVSSVTKYESDKHIFEDNMLKNSNL